MIPEEFSGKTNQASADTVEITQTMVSPGFGLWVDPGVIKYDERVKKAQVTQSIIEQLGELRQQAQISVLRAVAEFYEVADDLSR
jgi:nicotinamide mononucleotide (NMN) deamidase PncC